MNFFDLCVVCGRAIGRLCAACWHLLERMIRLTYRYWWIVLTLVALSIAAALYYTRHDNLTYKIDAVALLNGPTIPQFEQAYAAMRTNRLLPPEAPIAPYLNDRKAWAFDTYRVIDCLHDNTADYIDFKRKSSPTDTVRVQMVDRLCLEFCIKARDLHLVPEIEQALMITLNRDPAMNRSYETYLKNLSEEVAFNHRQAIKLDSLTSHYYYHTPSGQNPSAYVGNGVNFYGERRIHIFLDKIYEQQKHTQMVDYRMQLATAPVVLENHFAVNPKPVNSRSKYLVIFCLLGWIGGCVLAEIIDKRKAIGAWLKK